LLDFIFNKHRKRNIADPNKTTTRMR